jgi:diguanylate cyclase (GGDEF)-like protein
MSGTETAAYQVVDRALEQDVPVHRSQLLLADSSEAHLKIAVTRGPDDAPAGCSVGSPHECPAIRRGVIAVYPDDRARDACPFLYQRADHRTAAVCIPVNMIGRSIGVLHTAAAIQRHPSQPRIAELEAVADQVGARIGILRVMEQTHLQAATDSLTGLMNRRTVENQVHELLHRRTPFSLAMGDLDNFKVLNDTHGHEGGDRALRLFARVIKSALRSADFISRFGGEEFLIVFPNLSAEQAVAALQRVQEQLLVALSNGDVPAFTASFGVAHSDAASSFDDLARLADHSLFAAKRQGRNRVVLDSTSSPVDLSAISEQSLDSVGL